MSEDTIVIKPNNSFVTVDMKTQKIIKPVDFVIINTPETSYSFKCPVKLMEFIDNAGAHDPNACMSALPDNWSWEVKTINQIVAVVEES